jgi:DNA-binding NarL/FixJ family response regulator
MTMKVVVPRMDGLEATKRIKLAWPETKVIVAVHPGRVPGSGI